MDFTITLIQVQNWQFESKIVLSPSEFITLLKVSRPSIVFQWSDSVLDADVDQHHISTSLPVSGFYFYYSNTPHLVYLQEPMSFQEFYGIYAEESSTLPSPEVIPKESSLDEEAQKLMKEIGDSIFKSTQNNASKEEVEKPDLSEESLSLLLQNKLDLSEFSPEAQKIIELRRQIEQYENEIKKGDLLLSEILEVTDKIKHLRSEITDIIDSPK